MNLLEITQRVLSAIDAENISSVDETVEAAQVVELVNTIYEELMEYPWKWLETTGSLEITTTANKMRIPSTITQVNWIKYNKKDLVYKEPKDFLDILDSRDTTETNVDANGCITDQDPSYYTSIDGDTIEFDSYDSSLVSAYSKFGGLSKVETLIVDTDTPDIPERFHSVLLRGVLAEAFRTLKQDPQAAAVYDGKFMRSKIRMKRWGDKLARKDSTYANDFGRRQVGTRQNVITSRGILNG